MMSKNESQTTTAFKVEPQKEHQWLQKLVGEWTYEGEAPPEPGKASEKVTGTERVRSIGGLWFLAEGEGEMPGIDQATTLLTLGYDPEKKRYVGTFIGSMMTYLWVYTDGELDPTERVLTLSSDGPSMTDFGKMVKYRDVIEFKNNDHRVLTSNSLDEDGTWRQIMKVEYRRKK